MRALPAAVAAMQPTTEEHGREAHEPTELALGIAGGAFGAHGGDTGVGQLILRRCGGSSPVYLMAAVGGAHGFHGSEVLSRHQPFSIASFSTSRSCRCSITWQDAMPSSTTARSEEHTSELQSHSDL